MQSFVRVDSSPEESHSTTEAASSGRSFPSLNSFADETFPEENWLVPSIFLSLERDVGMTLVALLCCSLYIEYQCL